MATVLKANQRNFEALPNKIDGFRVLSDAARIAHGVEPRNLNFDLRRLDPGEFSAPYHFHRHAEELFMIVSGSVTLRTTDGLQILETGDLAFFGMGEQGAHQLHNHSDEPCIYLDVRTFIGHDVCEYPDSGKLFIAPTYEVFRKDTQVSYFDGEENVRERWDEIVKNTP